VDVDRERYALARRARGRVSQREPDSALGFAPVDELELEELAVVEMIPSELDGEVQRHAQRRHAVRHLPSDTVQAAALRVFEGETEMHVFKDDGALAQDDPTHAKHRLRVALPEGLQRLELLHEAVADLSGREPRGDLEFGLGDVAARVSTDRGGEGGAEFRQVSFIERDADGHRVAPPAGEAFATRTEDGDEVDAVDAAAGAFGGVAFVAEDDAGAVVFARDATGDDADDARVPVFTEKDDAGFGGKLGLDHALGFFGDAALDVLALAVKTLELARSLGAKRRIFAEE